MSLCVFIAPFKLALGVLGSTGMQQWLTTKKKGLTKVTGLLQEVRDKMTFDVIRPGEA
jgi:hypothetical protein